MIQGEDRDEFDSYSMGVEDGIEAISVNLEVHQERLSEMASKLAQKDATENGKADLKAIIDPSTGSHESTLESSLERYREDSVMNGVISRVIDEYPEVELMSDLESAYGLSSKKFKSKYAMCDRVCLQRYAQAFEATYLRTYREELTKLLKDTYQVDFLDVYRVTYQEYLEHIRDEFRALIDRLTIDNEDATQVASSDLIEFSRLGSMDGSKAGLKAGFYRSRELLEDLNMDEILSFYRGTDRDIYYLRTIDLDNSFEEPVDDVARKSYRRSFEEAFDEAYRRSSKLDQREFIEELSINYPSTRNAFSVFLDEYRQVHNRRT